LACQTILGKIQTRIKNFQQYFKGWGFNKQGEQRKLKVSLQELILEQTKEEDLGVYIVI
jgi:hypothetical protein